MLDNKGRDQFGVILCIGFFGKSCALEFMFWELWRLNMAYVEFKILECELHHSHSFLKVTLLRSVSGRGFSPIS
jgi:hypothetical protein